MIKKRNQAGTMKRIHSFAWLMFTKRVAALLFLALPVVAGAQTDTLQFQNKPVLRNIGLEGMYQYGHVFATNAFLKGVNEDATRISSFQALSLKLSLQATGKKQWEQSYKYPQYGLGLYVADFFDAEEIGFPVAVYGFLNAPFHRWNKLTFNYEIGFGATFNWKSFNPITNQFNVAIGAGESFLIDAGLNLQYLITNRIEIASGFSMTHFSNGALKKPNFGINTFAPKISVKYDFFDKPRFLKQETPEFNPQNEWLISAYAGLKNVVFDSVNIATLEKYEGVDFPVFGISATFNRQLSYKSKLGLGFTLSHNGAVNAQAAVDANELDIIKGKFTDQILLSIYPSYELVIYKASVTLQPSFYIYRRKLLNQSPAFHQRVGLKYHITDHVFVGITLVDYRFHVSDFIEWNLGYRIKCH